MSLENVLSTPSVAPPTSATKPPEAPAASEKPKTDDLDQLSSKFAALSKRERELYKKELEWKQKEKEYSEFQALKQKAKENPHDYLKTAGLTFDELVQMELKRGEPPSTDDKLKTLEEQLAEMKRKEAEAEEKAQRQRQDEEYKKAREGFLAEINKTVESDKERFELVNSFGEYAKTEVLETCQAYYQKRKADGYPDDECVLPIDKAADLVEAELLEQAKLGMSAKKIRALLADSQKDTKLSDKTEVPPTLTNKTAPVAPSGDSLPMDPEERRRIIAARYNKK